MKKPCDQSSEGLNQLFEIINAKGDKGELQEIVEKSEINEEKNSNEEDWNI